jgi:hypothetical protein
MDDFEPESGEPLHKPGEGGGIWELGIEGRRARAYDDFAVIEFCAQYGARLASESDLIHLRSHWDCVPQLARLPLVASLPGGSGPVVIHPGGFWSA